MFDDLWVKETEKKEFELRILAWLPRKFYLKLTQKAPETPIDQVGAIELNAAKRRSMFWDAFGTIAIYADIIAQIEHTTSDQFET